MHAVSIDIETTGLEPRIHGIVQIGACVFDMHSPQIFPETFTVDISPDGLVWTNYCLELHKDWIADMLKKERLPSQEEAVGQLIAWYRLMSAKYSPDGKGLTVVGKNFGRFDWRFLNEHGLADTVMPVRSADPSILFLNRDDSRLPDLPTCLKRAGLQKVVAHTALEDAIDVARCVQAGLVANDRMADAVLAAEVQVRPEIMQLREANSDLQNRWMEGRNVIERMKAEAEEFQTRVQVQAELDQATIAELTAERDAFIKKYEESVREANSALSQLSAAKDEIEAVVIEAKNMEHEISTHKQTIANLKVTLELKNGTS